MPRAKRDWATLGNGWSDISLALIAGCDKLHAEALQNVQLLHVVKHVSVNRQVGLIMTTDEDGPTSHHHASVIF